MRKNIFVLMVFANAYAASESNIYEIKSLQSSQPISINSESSQTMNYDALNLDVGTQFQQKGKQQLEQMIQNYNQDPN